MGVIVFARRSREIKSNTGRGKPVCRDAVGC